MRVPLSLVPRVVVALLFATTACYRNVPVELAQVAPGTPVKVHLTAVAQDRLRQENPAGPRRESLTGKFVRLTTDSAVIGVESTVMEANVRTRTFYSDVPLLRADLRLVERRELNRRRTALTVAGLGIGAIAAVLVAVEYGGSSTGTVNPGPGVPEQRIPLGIRLAIP
ncbi:MAG: hypothetical protein IPK85_23745 [Gemmatimonadetes bacterium]|nr:hypothetical protein [Gemmatimonadota bacterium]